MDLTIAERLMAQQVLPERGNMLTLRVLMETREVLGFTSEEIKELGLKVETTADGRVNTSWPPEKAAKTCEIVLSDAALQMLRDALDKLNGDEQLTVQHISLFEKVYLSGEKGDNS